MMKHEQTILIINDEPEQVELVGEMMRRSGYGVLTASDGREGFEAAQAARPDLIISDVVMPRVDGIELCRLLRAQLILRLTPVLLVSAHRRDSESVVAGLEAGADDYLEAPFDPARLLAKVARLLERKKVEATVRRSEERYRALIENTSDIITILKVDGTIKYESPSITRILGYQPEELIARNVFELVHPDDLAHVTEGFQETLRPGGISQPLEYRFRHRNGSWCDFESIGKTFIDESGELVGVVNSRNVSERKRAERALRFQAHLLNTVKQAVIATDLEGKIIYLNRFAETLYGWPGAEACGRNIMEIMPAPTRLEQAMEIMSHLRTGRSWAGEFTVRHRDGTLFESII